MEGARGREGASNIEAEGRSRGNMKCSGPCVQQPLKPKDQKRAQKRMRHARACAPRPLQAASWRARGAAAATSTAASACASPYARHGLLDDVVRPKVREFREPVARHRQRPCVNGLGIPFAGGADPSNMKVAGVGWRAEHTVRSCPGQEDLQASDGLSRYRQASSRRGRERARLRDRRTRRCSRRGQGCGRG